MSSREPTTTQASSGGQPVANARWLLIVGDGHLAMHPLPEKGEMVLGRDQTCDIRLDHSKISRRHARLVVSGGVYVEDLGSTNGIRVGDRRLELGKQTRISVGESLQLGPYTAMLVEGSAVVRSVEEVRAAVVVRDPTPAGLSELVARVARSNINVLVLGETGVGKEVLTQSLHELSARKGLLVAINCATLGETLLESELFGHERGAFTGAVKTKPGLLEVAAGGTVLLDEIGDLSAGLQAKLLRALETRTILRVGGVKPIDLDVRIVAATHRDLAAEVALGRFRQDLYFRLNGITLRIPPLRERRDQIPGLIEKFLGPGQSVAPAAIATLTKHSWPGNVRELRQVMERALLLAGGAPIGVRHLMIDAPPSAPAPVAAHAPVAAPAPPAPAAAFSPPVGKGAQSPAEDPDAFAALAREHHGNVSSLARVLDTSRSHVRRLAKRHGVDLDALR
jgi:two-component system, NtrC family, response regulator AtoC